MTAPPLGDVGVVVVSYGSSDLLRENLVPLAVGAAGIHVVVVENSEVAADRRATAALAAQQGWELVLPDRNLGFGDGVNEGAAAALELGVDWLLLLNPDATIGADGLDALRSAALSDPGALYAPRILRPDGSTWSEVSDLYLDDGTVRSKRRRIAGATTAEWLSGACLFLHRELWAGVGGFASGYFLYWEDVDLSWRVTRQGGGLVVVDGAVAVHNEGGTQRDAAPRDAKSPLYYYYNVRNRLVFAAKNLPAVEVRRWRRATPRMAYRVLTHEGRRQLLRPRAAVLPVIRGAIDGLVASRPARD